MASQYNHSAIEKKWRENWEKNPINVNDGKKEKYYCLIIQCVADMRTQDMRAIREFGKFVPAFAAFEKNRLNLYREAAKEAEEIFDRWADEIDDLDEDFMEDEDYEPDEYYSD